MSNIKTFFEECLTLPWKPNPQNNPQHENQVEKLLIKHGIKYVYQPNGKQKPPDFKILHDKVYDPYFKCDGWKSSISVECKSSKQVYPTYNSTLPQKETVYIFSSQKYNETTIHFSCL